MESPTQICCNSALVSFDLTIGRAVKGGSVDMAGSEASTKGSKFTRKFSTIIYPKSQGNTKGGNEALANC